MKRAEIVHGLIETIRDNEDIATVMDIIDWNEAFSYDGKFHLRKSDSKELQDKSDDDLFYMIDKTLSHFSYVCYLRNQKVLKRKDMRSFEYCLKRIFDNYHIGNYLFSLYHWSKHLGTTMSFIFLIEYALKKGYLSESFTQRNSTDYTCYLELYDLVYQ